MAAFGGKAGAFCSLRVLSLMTHSDKGERHVLSVKPCSNFQPNAIWIVTVRGETIPRSRRPMMSGLGVRATEQQAVARTQLRRS